MDNQNINYTADNMFINAAEVCQILGVCKTKSFQIIKQLNKKLSDAGKIVIAGKVNRAYFMKQINCDDVA